MNWSRKALFLALAILLGFAVGMVMLAQAPALQEMHVPAPEFPPPANTEEVSPSGGLGHGGPPPVASGPDMSGVSGSTPSASQSGGMPSSIYLNPNAGITWINSRPLSLAALRGKVVMIDFWDYTCINCIRTFPENKKLWNRYRNDGFVLIGVDDAEFASASPVNRVREAVKRFELPYPVVVDYHLQIWNAYKNQFWPNIFLIDAHGIIRYNHPGEGADNEIEHAIQSLLKEAHPDLTFPAGDTGAANVNPAASGCGGAPTPEMYVGDWTGRGVLANPRGYHDHKTIDYAQQSSVEDGRVVLSGRWETEKEGMIYRGKRTDNEPGPDRATMQYHARELYSVLNLARGRSAVLYIKQDGAYLTAANKGADVKIDPDGRSYLEIREPRMYYLVQNPQFGSHTVDLFPTADGAMIDSFTFGNNCQTDFDHL